MYFSTSLLLSLSTLLVATIAQSTNIHVHDVKCHAFPRPILPRIGNTNATQPLPLEGVTNLALALANNTQTPVLPASGLTLGPAQAKGVRWGDGVENGYKVCVQNFYFGKTLTVPLDILSDVVTQIKDNCCKPAALFPQIGKAGADPIGREGDCQDSKAMITLGDGSEIIVVGQDFNDNCCGMFGCERG